MLYLETAYTKEAFTKHIPKDIKTIFEIGARELHDSNNLSIFYKEADVYSYECNPLTVPICLENLKKYNNSKIHFFNKALSDKEEILEFHNFSSENHGASSFFKREDYLKTQKTLFSIKTSTIENELFLHDLEKIDLLCMDVQGFELKILKGVNLQKTKISNIILEAPKSSSVYVGAPNRQEIENYLKKFGYVIKEVIQENLIEDNVLFCLKN